jgi:hypothetical protein
MTLPTTAGSVARRGWVSVERRTPPTVRA